MLKTFKEVNKPTVEDGIWVYQDKKIPYEKVKIKFRLICFLSVFFQALMLIPSNHLAERFQLSLALDITVYLLLVLLEQLIFWALVKIYINHLK